MRHVGNRSYPGSSAAHPSGRAPASREEAQAAQWWEFTPTAGGTPIYRPAVDGKELLATGEWQHTAGGPLGWS